MDGEHGSIEGKVFTEFSEVRGGLHATRAAASAQHTTRHNKQTQTKQIKTSAGTKRFLKFFLHEAGEGGGRYLAATGEDQGDAHYVYTVRGDC